MMDVIWILPSIFQFRASQNASSMKETVIKHTSSNAVYGLGLLGAVIYFISKSTSIWSGIIGCIKALFWPAIIVYEALSYLGI